MNLSPLIFLFLALGSHAAVNIVSSSCTGANPNQFTLISENETSFTVSLQHDNIVAYTGAGSDSRRYCVLGFQLYGPAGERQFRISAYHYTGTVQLAAGAKATLNSTFVCQWDCALPQMGHVFEGPINETYTTRVLPSVDYAWASCDHRNSEVYSVSTSIRAVGADGEGFISAVQGGKVQFTYELEWQNC